MWCYAAARTLALLTTLTVLGSPGCPLTGWLGSIVLATNGKKEQMTDYLPEVYQQFERRFPAVKESFDSLGAAEHEAGPLGEKERRLVKLGIAVGAESEGAVRSHVRKLLGIGASEEEILHSIVLALTTIGFPATNAALGWAEEVLSEESDL